MKLQVFRSLIPRQVGQLSVVTLVMGIVIKGAPADPDQNFGVGLLLGSALIFSAWLICIRHWGQLIATHCRLPNAGLLESFAIGSLVASLAAAVMGHLGWIGYSYSGLGILVMLLGPVLNCARKTAPKAPRAEFSFKRLGWNAPLIALVVLLGARGLQSFLAHGTSDPFLYHLLGPRLWADHGRILYLPDHAIAFQCWYWEYLYVWGNLLLGGPGGAGLIEGQFFGQWVHVFLGSSLTALALGRLLEPLAPSRAWLCLAILAGMGSLSLGGVSWLAKNDWGSIGWLLAGAALLICSPDSQRTRLWGTALLIASVLCKPSGVFAATPLGVLALVLLWRRAQEPAARPGSWTSYWFEVGKHALIALAVAAPLLLRNRLLAGSWGFPYDAIGGDSPMMSPTQAIVWKKVSQGIQFAPQEWLAALLRLLKDHPLNWLFLAAPLFMKNDARRPLFFGLWLSTLLGLIWFPITRFEVSFTRWAGAPLVMMSALVTIRISLLISESKWIGARAGLVAQTLGALALLLWALPPGVSIGSILYVPPTLVIRDPALHIGGEAKAWLRLHAQPGQKIVSTGDNQIYYISHLSPVIIPESRELDRGQADPLQLVKDLRAYGAKYALDSPHWAQRYWSSASLLLHQAAQAAPAAWVFNGKASGVLDLEILEKSLSKSGSEGAASDRKN